MEQILSSTNFISLFLAELFEAVFFFPLLSWSSRIKKFYVGCVLCLTWGFFSAGSKQDREEKTEEEEELRFSTQEMRMVMEMMGISCDATGSDETFHAHDFNRLFDEEPSLEEVKEVFSVFDRNGDGFIDAEELQTVLSKLGFPEGSTVENCRGMISVYDDNKDGKIDFPEFVKFLEISFS